MTRTAREWYQNCVMHITSRGNRRNEIFRDEEDYVVYLHIVQEALTYFKEEFELLAYVLMTNHVHLQVATKQTHIGVLMKKINFFYARYFNNKYNYVGHLFQERYGSEIIRDDRYLLEASRYIHLNPVKANMVKSPAEYRYSSYRMYIGLERENFIHSEIILSFFNQNRESYKEFVEIK